METSTRVASFPLLVSMRPSGLLNRRSTFQLRVAFHRTGVKPLGERGTTGLPECYGPLSTIGAGDMGGERDGGLAGPGHLEQGDEG